jgi:hypothetical protein
MNVSMRLLSGDVSASCYCNPGYEGDRCEININECQSDPCRNNAVCVDGINSFQCRCLPGTKGKYCEEGELGHLCLVLGNTG